MDGFDFNPSTGCLTITGEFTVYQAAGARDMIAQISSDGALKTVNLDGVTEIDSAGLQLLLCLKKTPNTASTIISSMSETVQSVLQMLQLEQDLLGAPAEMLV